MGVWGRKEEEKRGKDGGRKKGDEGEKRSREGNRRGVEH